MQNESEQPDKPEEGLTQDQSESQTQSQPSDTSTSDTGSSLDESTSTAPSTTPPVVPSTVDAAPADEGGAKPKILLVEDDVALAAVYRSRLELEGFELYEVNDGEQALQAAKEFRPDLILLDAMMPKISGFDVLDILRNTPETTDIKVIMLTALSQSKDKERAESLGVNDYLVKSQVVIGDVVDRVKHHLEMD